MDRIESRDNQKLKTIRRLRRSKGKQSKARGLLLEGPHLLQTALDRALALEMVLVTEKAANEHAALLDRCNCPIALSLPEHLAEVADTDSPQGLVAVAHHAALSLEELESVQIQPNDVFVYCSELRDPGNLGALARSSAAAGVRALLLSDGCVHPFHPRALRASAGALLSLPVAHPIPLRVPGALGLKTVALVPSGGTNLWSASLPTPLMLVVGSEASGLDAEAIEAADRTITIPMAVETESLNATVAASIVLFELRRREYET